MGEEEAQCCGRCCMDRAMFSMVGVVVALGIAVDLKYIKGMLCLVSGTLVPSVPSLVAI